MIVYHAYIEIASGYLMAHYYV